MPVVTPDDARLALGIDDDDTSVDDELQGYVDGITAVIERHTGLVIDETEVTERHWLTGGRFALRKVPVLEITDLTTVDGLTTWNVDDYLVDAESGIVEWGGVTGTTLYGHVQVTYTAGYETVPAHVKQGALIILQHIWETQRGAGTVGAGVVGPEESWNGDTFTIPRKALEWLGAPAMTVA